MPQYEFTGGEEREEGVVVFKMDRREDAPYACSNCQPTLRKLGIDEMGKRRIEQLKEANANLYTGYLLKEQVFTFCGFESRADAETYLDEWASSCVKSNLKPFVALGRRLKRHRASILAYFDYKISNGFAEGINNKVKVIKRMAFGYRDFAYFRLKVFAATGKLAHLPRYIKSDAA